MKRFLYIISVNCLENGKSEENKDQFYNKLSTETMARNREYIIMGNFNGMRKWMDLKKFRLLWLESTKPRRKKDSEIGRQL